MMLLSPPLLIFSLLGQPFGSQGPPSLAQPSGGGAEGEAPIALRLSGQLMLGVVKVFARKVCVGNADV